MTPEVHGIVVLLIAIVLGFILGYTCPFRRK